MTTSTTKKGTTRATVLVVAGGLVLCVVCIVVLWSIGARIQASPDFQATQTAKPTATLHPTRTPAPLSTERPTRTPIPTKTPYPTPTPIQATIATPATTLTPSFTPLLSKIWTGVKVYHGTGSEKTYGFEILGGSEDCRTIGRGVYVQYPDETREWKDRTYLVTSGLFFVLSDDPAAKRLEWREYPNCP